MLLTVGMVIVVLSKAPYKTPMTMNPFMLVMMAVITVEVSPESGEEMVMVGVVKIWISVLSK